MTFCVVVVVFVVVCRAEILEVFTNAEFEQERHFLYITVSCCSFVLITQL